NIVRKAQIMDVRAAIMKSGSYDGCGEQHARALADLVDVEKTGTRSLIRDPPVVHALSLISTSRTQCEIARSWWHSWSPADGRHVGGALTGCRANIKVD